MRRGSTQCRGVKAISQPRGGRGKGRGIIKLRIYVPRVLYLSGNGENLMLEILQSVGRMQLYLS